jgi:D-alanyl-D-alanine carboxypeptidase
MTIWPTQAEADGFYGNPRGRNGKASKNWEAEHLVSISPPFQMYYAGSAIRHFKIHRKCAESLMRVFAAIWQAAGQDQSKVEAWGVSTFGGSYNFRLMRNSNRLSMHSFGCAIDLAPDRFPLGRKLAGFAPEVLIAFEAEGWVNLPRDRMHFQAARLR